MAITMRIKMDQAAAGRSPGGTGSLGFYKGERKDETKCKV